MFSKETIESILKGLTANNVHRNFCVMGGEPLCQENLRFTHLLISTVKKRLPQTKIYIWTGYLYEELLALNNSIIQNIFSIADYLIDGPFEQDKKDLTLLMRGSTNQRIINLKTKEEYTHGDYR